MSVLYYDPIHDYGFLKFDPKAIKRTVVSQLELRPEDAVNGLQIRVIGNDAAQRLTISEGIISRVNRNAPTYYGYRDFNINYIQGSAMTSGGSSGSPVIDSHGNVVALNAGSISDASVALFLPLEHPLKTLKHLVRNEPAPRGTLQTSWALQPYHECQALGLTDEWVSTIQEQRPGEEDMLVVTSVLPQGPADTKLETGDVILKADGAMITKFSEITEILDGNVDKEITLTVQRWDQELKVELTVEDLHAITPNKYFLINKTAFHNFSYQMASQWRLPVQGSGVYCTAEGFFGTGVGGSLIQSVNGRKTKDLEAFIEVLQSVPGQLGRHE